MVKKTEKEHAEAVAKADYEEVKSLATALGIAPLPFLDNYAVVKTNLMLLRRIKQLEDDNAKTRHEKALVVEQFRALEDKRSLLQEKFRDLENKWEGAMKALEALGGTQLPPPFRGRFY